MDDMQPPAASVQRAAAYLKVRRRARHIAFGTADGVDQRLPLG
jgi:hypothetical protein